MEETEEITPRHTKRDSGRSSFGAQIELIKESLKVCQEGQSRLCFFEDKYPNKSLLTTVRSKRFFCTVANLPLMNL